MDNEGVLITKLATGLHSQKTAAPVSAKALAVASLMPEPAPVTSATLFSKGKFMMVSPSHRVLRLLVELLRHAQHVRGEFLSSRMHAANAVTVAHDQRCKS